MLKLKFNFKMPSLFTAALFIFFASTPSWAGSLTMTTYYPAPQGSYDRMTLIPQAIDQTATCTVGTMMSDSTTGRLLYCHDLNGSSAGKWGTLDNIWTQTDNYVYPTNTIPVTLGQPIYGHGQDGRNICSPDAVCQPCIPDPKTGMECLDVMPPEWCYCEEDGSDAYDLTAMGIGTSTPLFKLTLENDGGILALGNYGTGNDFPGFTCLLVGRYCPTAILDWLPRKAAFHAGGLTNNSIDATPPADFSVAFGLIDVGIVPPMGVTNIATTSSGYNNSTNGQYSTIAGGNSNITNADYATITGGSNNIINLNASYSTISGSSNTVGGQYNTIGGGININTSTINPTGIGITVGGGEDNDVIGEGSYATIAGGKINSITTSNDSYSVIGGGIENTMTNDSYSTIGGGEQNTTQGSTTLDVEGNSVLLSSYAYIGGGFHNSNNLNDLGRYSVVGGGSNNAAGGDYSVVSGGYTNDAEGNYTTILGGSYNTTHKVQIGETGSIPPVPIYSGNYSVIAGGLNNDMKGAYSVIAGGNNNTVDSDYSWAGGRYMNLTSTAHRTFAWGYSDTAVNITTPDAFIIAPGTDGAGAANPFLSIHETSPSGILSITRDGATDSSDYFAVTSSPAANAGDIFVVKSNGYIGIGKYNPSKPLEFGPQANGAYLTAGGVWTSTSSRKFKDNIKPLETQQAVATLKELRPVTYNYKIDKNEHHVGFIAEEMPDLIAAEGRKSVDPMNVTAILTSVLKEQEHNLEQQDAVLNNLESELQSLKTELQKK